LGGNVKLKKRKYQKLVLYLRPKDKKIIRKVLKAGDGSVRVIKRMQILKLLHKKVSSCKIAEYIGVSLQTVYNIGLLYLQHGLNKAVYDLPRPGRKSLLNLKQSQRIIAMVCTDPPEGQSRWTIRLITEETINRGMIPQIGRETVRILLKTHDIKPWREKMWCIPKLNQEYIDRMEDLLDLYERPYNSKEPVLCLDERPIQLLSDMRESIPMKPGHVKKKDYEYKRYGTANAFCIVEPKAGDHITKITSNRKSEDFAKMIYQIARKYPKADIIQLVMDNLNTHKLKSLTDKYGIEKGNKIWNRFTIHYTPVHASWLNQAEIEISLYSKQCLGKRRIQNIELLKKETKAWNRRVNKKKIKINWRWTVKDARRKFKYNKIEKSKN